MPLLQFLRPFPDGVHNFIFVTQISIDHLHNNLVNSIKGKNFMKLSMKTTKLKNKLRQRSGAAIVEFAMVCVMFFTMLFGIFEYARFIFVLHMMNNAARDAVRYAAVKTNGGNMPNDPNTVLTEAQLQTLVLSGVDPNKNVIGPGLMGFQKNINNFSVNTFTVDPTGLDQTTPVINPLMYSGAQAPWNSATFNQPIAVRISGTYSPIASGLLFLPTNMPFQVTVMMNSEAN